MRGSGFILQVLQDGLRPARPWRDVTPDKTWVVWHHMMMMEGRNRDQIQNQLASFTRPKVSICPNPNPSPNPTPNLSLRRLLNSAFQLKTTAVGAEVGAVVFHLCDTPRFHPDAKPKTPPKKQPCVPTPPGTPPPENQPFYQEGLALTLTPTLTLTQVSICIVTYTNPSAVCNPLTYP